MGKLQNMIYKMSLNRYGFALATGIHCYKTNLSHKIKCNLLHS